MTISDHLSGIEQRAGKATTGPWFSDGEPEHGCCWDVSVQCHDAHERLDGGKEPNTMIAEASKGDGNFIAHSRQDVPRLCEALRRAMTTLNANAKPAIGGKQQQYDARAALKDLAAILSKP